MIIAAAVLRPFRHRPLKFGGFAPAETGEGEAHMRTAIYASLLFCVVSFVGSARAEECRLHCDYWHFYGPYDFSYVSPGLLGYPLCDREGNCSPFLTYVFPGRRHGRVTVRPAPHH